ncbi:transposase [Undibacterium sp. Ji83W]|uniref:transposase n=1 Tax=Undibacterium sp. Ji83W TaxID=3413043 RepID=UPI003BF58863
MIDDGINTPRRRRRQSTEFKAQVIQACKQPSVSIAVTALRYQLNANLVRIWIRAHDQLAIKSTQTAPVTPVPEFIPIQLPAPTMVSTTPDIVIEIRPGAANVTVRWPHAAAAECANWLQNWLR